MLVLESYKTIGVDFQEVAMTGESERFDRVGQASEREWRDSRNQRRNSPADQLMYAWSLDASERKEEPTKISQRLEACPPEVYIG